MLVEYVREKRGDSIYLTAARKFNTSYTYVVQIATGIRKAKRGKGLDIKRWLETQLNIDK